MKTVERKKISVEDIKKLVEMLNKEEEINESVENVSIIKKDEYGTNYIEVNNEQIPLCVFADVIKRLLPEKYALYLVTYYTHYEHCVLEIYNDLDDCIYKTTGDDEAYAIVSWFIRKYIQKKGE